MANYEVKVTPTIEINMEQLKNEVRQLSKVINREATGRLRLELDGRGVERQAQKIVRGVSQTVDHVSSEFKNDKISAMRIRESESELEGYKEAINKANQATE